MKVKKLLAVLLSAAMVLSLGITSVSAATTVAKIGTTPYTSLEAAVAAANAVPEGSTKATITLKSNVAISDTLVFTRDVTLDLGRYTITNKSQGEAIRAAFTKGTATVKATTGGINSPNGKQCFVIRGAGNSTNVNNTAAQLKVNGGTYDSGEANEAISFDYNAPANCSLQIDKNNTKYVYIIGGINLDTAIRHRITQINNATITSSCENTINTGKSILEMTTKMVINSKGRYAIYAPKAPEDPDQSAVIITISNSELNLYGKSGIYADGGTINMSKGNTLNVLGADTKNILKTGNGGTINVIHGMFYMNNASYLFGSGVNITGGTYYLENASNVFEENTGKTISDGTFNGPSAAMAEINKHKADAGTAETYAKVAKIGENKYYGTLAEAFTAATDGKTIKLIDDAEITDTNIGVVANNVTLDLNGHDVSVANATTGSINVSNSGKTGASVIFGTGENAKKVTVASANTGSATITRGNGKTTVALAKSGDTVTVDGITHIAGENSGSLEIDDNKKICQTDTDSGSYKSGSDTLGVIRYMFVFNESATDGKITSYGIKYLKSNDFGSVTTSNANVSATGNYSAFQGDITEIPANETTNYYAKAFIVRDGITIWSNAVPATVDWAKSFTNYQPQSSATSN